MRCFRHDLAGGGPGADTRCTGEIMSLGWYSPDKLEEVARYLCLDCCPCKLAMTTGHVPELLVLHIEQFWLLMLFYIWMRVYNSVNCYYISRYREAHLIKHWKKKIFLYKTNAWFQLHLIQFILMQHIYCRLGPIKQTCPAESSILHFSVKTSPYHSA